MAHALDWDSEPGNDAPEAAMHGWEPRAILLP